MSLPIFTCSVQGCQHTAPPCEAFRAHAAHALAAVSEGRCPTCAGPLEGPGPRVPGTTSGTCWRCRALWRVTGERWEWTSLLDLPHRFV